MTFEKKDFELLYSAKLTCQVNSDNVETSYFLVYRDKILFISKSRKKYKLLCSSTCGFVPIARERVFDLLFSSEDFYEVRQMFSSYAKRIIIFGDNDLI